MKKGFKSAWSSLKNSKTGMFGLILVLLIIICAIFAPLLAPYDPLAQDVMIKLKDPIWGSDPVAGHLLGTDQLGRDILSRLLYGARVTLIVALAGTVVGGIVGVVLGSLAGYYGKWVDAVIMRLVDIQLCFPFTLLALFIAAVLAPAWAMSFCTPASPAGCDTPAWSAARSWASRRWSILRPYALPAAPMPASFSNISCPISSALSSLSPPWRWPRSY